MFVIAGLGNPGNQYANTLHNVGFEMVSALNSDQGWKSQKQSLCSQTTIAGHKCLLALPQAYMNRSGDPIFQLLHFYKIPLQNLIVVLDDMQLPLSTLRIRQKGSDGGHNGLKDIIRISGPNFTRIRIGVGPPPPTGQWRNFVLRKWTDAERKQMELVKEIFPQVIESGLSEGWDKAASKFNGSVSG